MPIKYQLPIQNDYTVIKAKKMLDMVRERLSSGVYNSPDEVLADLNNAFNELFSTLRQPFTKSPQLTVDDLRNQPQLSSFWRSVADDIDILIEGAKGLTGALTSNFNLATVRNKRVEVAVAKTQSLSADLQLLDDDLSVSILIAGDDFSTPDRIDKTAHDKEQAEIFPGGFGLGLKRTGTKNAITAKASVTADAPAGSYEGDYFAPLGEATPDGSKFNWKSIPVEEMAGICAWGKGPVNNPFDKWRSIGKSKRSPFAKALETVAGIADKASDTAKSIRKVVLPGHASIAAFVLGKPGKWKGDSVSDFKENIDETRVSPVINTVVFYADYAPEEELLVKRSVMLDEDPATFWQVELSRVSKAMENWQLIQEQEAAAAIERGLLPPEVTAADLIGEVSKTSAAAAPFDVTVTVDLGEVVPANWIALLPFNFQEGAWLEILSVETADLDKIFSKLPNLEEHLNERVLTPEANEDLQPEEIAGVLTDTKAFAGQGLWVFPERAIQYVRFIIRQPQAAPNPYSIYRLTLEQNFTIETKTMYRKPKTWKSGYSYKTKTATEDRTYNVDLELDYARSLMLHSGQYDVEQLMTGEEAGETETAGEERGLPKGLLDVLLLNPLNPVGRALSGILGISKWKAYAREVNVTPIDDWHVVEQEEVPKYDVVRYAIGIRDVAVSRFTFAESSAAVSVPFSTPNPIQKMSLVVNEHIPEEMQLLDRDRPWIEYFVSVDDKEWTAITPQSHMAAHNKDSVTVPMIININSDVPEEERNLREGYLDVGEDVHSVRLKIVMNRPTGEESNTMCPVVENYRLKLFCKESL